MAQFELSPLPYAYDALEPYIDAQTMVLHHDKHHAAYVHNLNKALVGHHALHQKSLTDLVIEYDKLPSAISETVRNNAGGDLNHTMFWSLLKKDGGEPRGKVHDMLRRDFGSIEAFKDTFSLSAKSLFGSGWAWLCLDKEGRLVVMSTPNQDSPLKQGLQPILGLDVWEHAYYLKYQNRRADYIQAWWHIINWERVEQNLEMLVV